MDSTVPWHSALGWAASATFTVWPPCATHIFVHTLLLSLTTSSELTTQLKHLPNTHPNSITVQCALSFSAFNTTSCPPKLPPLPSGLRTSSCSLLAPRATSTPSRSTTMSSSE